MLAAVLNLRNGWETSALSLMDQRLLLGGKVVTCHLQDGLRVETCTRMIVLPCLSSGSVSMSSRRRVEDEKVSDSCNGRVRAAIVLAVRTESPMLEFLQADSSRSTEMNSYDPFTAWSASSPMTRSQAPYRRLDHQRLARGIETDRRQTPPGGGGRNFETAHSQSPAGLGEH